MLTFHEEIKRLTIIATVELFHLKTSSVFVRTGKKNLFTNETWVIATVAFVVACIIHFLILTMDFLRVVVASLFFDKYKDKTYLLEKIPFFLRTM